jgi:PknH-like extracellular domain/TIR domain
VEAVLTVAHDVFISHSHEDKPAADAACAALEARGIRCWIAPRDIAPGQDWAASIVAAIQGAQIMLLVFSQHANQSPQVQREVERAASSGKVILPLRVDDVLPEAALAYYLGTPHWLDAITKPFEAHLEKLADACASLLAVTGRSPQDATNDPAPVSAAAATAQPSAGESGEPRPSVSPQLWWRRQHRQVQLALIAAIVVILAATGYLVWPHSPASKTQAAQPAVPSGPSSTTSPPVLPVAEAALEGLLLSPDQINTAMGATAMTVTATGTSMHDDSAVVSDKACQPMLDVGEIAAYAGSGWSATRIQTLREPGDTLTHLVHQEVVLFTSAHDAGAFFSASAQSWPACANRRFTLTLPGQPGLVWSVGPVANINGTLSTTKTPEGSNGWACQRALTVANNVAIDVTTCTSNPSDSAVNIAKQIAAKVPQ